MSTQHVEEDETKNGKNPRQDDIALLLQTHGLGQHGKDTAKRINGGTKESDTDLAASSEWDLVSDEQMMQEEQPLQRLVPDISLPPLPASPASMFASSGITGVLPSCMVSPTRNGVDTPVPAGPEWLPLTSMLTCALSRDEKFGFCDEYELQTQPNTPENFSFSTIEEILKNYSAVKEGLTKDAAVE